MLELDRAKLDEKRRSMRKRDTVQGVRQPGEVLLRTCELMNLLTSNGPLCRGCKRELEFRNYRPWSHRQYTFDRIDASLPHRADNLQVLCFSCNAARRPVQPPQKSTLLRWLSCCRRARPAAGS